VNLTKEEFDTVTELLAKYYTDRPRRGTCYCLGIACGDTRCKIWWSSVLGYGMLLDEYGSHFAGRAAAELMREQGKLITSQKPDPNHTRLTKDVIYKWAPKIEKVHGRVLDVGCGQAIAKPFWEEQGFEWFGVTLEEDLDVLKDRELGGCAIGLDMHLFAGFYKMEFDVVYARHILEHSPFPALALESWKKKAKYLIVVVPCPSQRSVNNHTHLSVLSVETWMKYFRLVGLDIVDFETVAYNNPPPWPQDGAEFRFFLRRKVK
jgi:SAM-dependent methyltransferase